MNDPIVFQPLQTTATTLWLIGILVVCASILIYSLIKKHKILTLLSGLGVLILLGSTVFNWLSDQRTTEVTVLDNTIETMYGAVHFRDIQNVYIQEDVKSPLTGEKTKANTSRYLVIESSKREFPMVLPEATFQIDSIKKVLDNRYKNWLESE